MNVYTIIHVRRTPVRRTCTPYMCASVNTALGLFVARRALVRNSLQRSCLQ